MGFAGKCSRSRKEGVGIRGRKKRVWGTVLVKGRLIVWVGRTLSGSIVLGTVSGGVRREARLHTSLLLEQSCGLREGGSSFGRAGSSGQTVSDLDSLIVGVGADSVSGTAPVAPKRRTGGTGSKSGASPCPSGRLGMPHVWALRTSMVSPNGSACAAVPETARWVHSPRGRAGEEGGG
jgi:hypothetical protein